MSAFEEFLNGRYGWLLILGIIIVFTALTIIFYTKKDKYDPEPPSRLIYAFILGIFSVIPAVILSILGALLVGFNEVFTSIIVAPVMEEFAKLYFVIYLAKSNEFDGPLDGLIYGAMVGAGFAAAENVLYGFVAVLGDGISTGITLTAIRSITQIVGHPLYTGLAGVGVGEWKVGLQASKYNKLWRSILFHASWNLSANLPSLSLIVIGLGTVIVVNLIYLRREFRRTLSLDKEAFDRGYYIEKAERSKMIQQQEENKYQQWVGSIGSVDQNVTQGISPVNQQLNPENSATGTSWVQPQGQNSDQSSQSQQSTLGPNFCRNCGSKRSEGDIFCRNCGTKQI